MAQNISTANVGNVFEALYMTLLERLDVLDTSKGGGLIALHQRFNSDLYLPSFDISGDTVVAWTADSVPEIATAQGGNATTIDYSERKLDTTDLTFAIAEIIPNEWRAVWEEFAPDTQTRFVDLMLNDEIRNAVLMRMVQRRGKFDSDIVWQGSTATGTPANLALYDGIVKRVVDAAGTNGTQDLTTTGTVPFTDANIAGELLKIYQGLLSRPALKRAEGLKIIMSENTLGLYESSEIAVSGKGVVNSQMNSIDNFRNIPIEVSDGFPDDFLLCTYTNIDPLKSTLHLGMRNVRDSEEIEFAPYANGAKKWYFRMDYSMGTQLVNLKDILFIDARA